MNTTTRFFLAVLPLALFAAGCDKDPPAPEKGSGLSEQRLMLSEGYSMLYADAAKIDLIDLLLYVKTETAEFDVVISKVSRYGGVLKQDLERIARDYPGVRIDLKPLPEMETRKCHAIGKDKAILFAPFIGIGGREFERSVLISLSNGINHESHLCKVMAGEEPDPGLKKFLLETEQHYQALYTLVMRLLEREHFKPGS